MWYMWTQEQEKISLKKKEQENFKWDLHFSNVLYISTLCIHPW